jgi:spermidine synthase
MLDSYHIMFFAAISIVAYAVSIFSVKRGRLALFAHRRLWNHILLITFVLSGLLGLVLAFLIDFKLSISWYREFLWLHVEFGIVMAFVAFFHICWHWRYFLRRTKKQTQA